MKQAAAAPAIRLRRSRSIADRPIRLMMALCC
jgi:hypothetical protein